MLYTDSSVDSSLMGLYVHQNYTQYCDEIEHAESVSEWLSLGDGGQGDMVRLIHYDSFAAPRLFRSTDAVIAFIHNPFTPLPVISFTPIE